MIELSEEFWKFAKQDKNGNVVGMKSGATAKAKRDYKNYKEIEVAQERKNKNAERKGTFAEKLM